MYQLNCTNFFYFFLREHTRPRPKTTLASSMRAVISLLLYENSNFVFKMFSKDTLKSKTHQL